MTLKEFISHLSHRSLSIVIYLFNIDSHTYSIIFDGSVGTLIHWKDFPKYSDHVVDSIEPDHNFFEVRIYG